MPKLAYIYLMIYHIKESESIGYLIKVFNLTDGNYVFVQGYLFVDGKYDQYIINKDDNPITLSQKLNIPICELMKSLNDIVQPGRRIWIKK